MLVRFSDSSWWKIPVQIIAESRAKYFAKTDSEDGEGEYDDIFNDELKYTLEDDTEIIDWAKNNMYWDDVKDFAIFEKQEKPNYSKEWINCDSEIIEIEE